jgi:hypothetical protein
MSTRIIDPVDALTMLKQHQPSFDQMNMAEITQNMKWQDEIAMLERRVKDVYEMVDLGNGDRIAVRTALSEEEMQNLQELEKRTAEIHKTITSGTADNELHEELSDITYQQIALMTANPIITADWLAENKARWPVSDALVVISSFIEESIKRRVGRVKEIQSFLGK